jgi:hypothetical protein
VPLSVGFLFSVQTGISGTGIDEEKSDGVEEGAVCTGCSARNRKREAANLTRQ